MNPENEGQQSGAALGASDVMYILFRHKWKIILFTLLGILGASGIWFLKRPVYESKAKILVKYVPERRNVSANSGDSEIVREPERGGIAVINSEVEILTSINCVLDAVNAIGPQKILAAYGGGTNDYDAAGVIQKYLIPKVGASGVVTISLGHPDPKIARQTLILLIEKYRKEHVRVHRAAEGYADLQAEADLIRERLAETERNLNTAKGAANVISLDEEKLEISSQLSSLRTSVFAAEAELAERKAELELAEGRFGATHSASKGTNQVITSNQKEYSAEKLETYKTLSAKLSYLQRRENNLLQSEFAETSRTIGSIRQQIADVVKAIAALEIDPAKAEALTRQVVTSVEPVFNPENDVNALRAKVRGLEARIEQLKLQRIEVQQNFAAIEAAEGRILQLERSRKADEERLRQYEVNLEKARLDSAIDANKITNITVVQDPTPAGRDMMKLYKLMAGALFGMIGAGVALGFVIEMFIDGSLKRPKDVEVKAGVPLFVSIPRFGVNGRARLKLSRKSQRNGELQDVTGLIPKGEIASWESSDPMFDYYESLRDRVVMSYEGDPRKPKIVAVTSCNRGAGTTRISTGLAAALSRDVHRRVLYIGLEKEKVAVTAFFKGRPQAEFAPEFDNQIEDGQSGVAPELYSLVQTGHSPQGISIVQTFSDMIPKLRMSEYDYIIFDLPPISETSGSLRLASQVERTLLVVESELTQKEKVERVRDLLSSTSTRMFAVLNKTQSYGPQVLAEQV